MHAALGGSVNVCRGEEFHGGLAELIRDLTGGRSLIQHLSGRPSDVLRLFGDASRLKSLLGTIPHVGIEAGLERTIDWFRDHVPLGGRTLQLLQMNSWESEPGETWIEEARDWKMRKTA